VLIKFPAQAEKLKLVPCRCSGDELNTSPLNTYFSMFEFWILLNPVLPQTIKTVL